LRIIQVIDSLSVGGAERMCVNIASILDQQCIENGIICTRSKGNLGEKHKGLLWVLNKKSGIDIIAFIKLVLLFRKWKPTIIHSHSTSLYWCVLIRLIQPKIKLVWHDHYGNSEFLYKRKKSVLKCCLRFVQEVIVVNEVLLRWYLEIIPNERAKFHFVRNFPMLNQVDYNFENRVPPFGTIKILQVANFREQKHLLLALQVLTTLKNFGIQLKWRFVGNIVDVEYYYYFLQEVNRLNLIREVEIVTDCTEVEPHLIWADIGVLTSKSEGLPVSLLEYGLANLPVVVTDVGQCSEILNGGLIGKLCTIDVQDFSNNLKDTILNYKEYLLSASKLKNHIEINFGYNGFLTNYLEIID
jgi:glycosyltransferase involved in cell wall biosynthesis